jgi:hypothetical protein
MLNWVSVDERLPDPGDVVLVLLNGDPRVGTRVWDHPGYEDTYDPFLYWDDPYDDGQDWECFEITHWAEIGELPETNNEERE